MPVAPLDLLDVDTLLSAEERDLRDLVVLGVNPSGVRWWRFRERRCV